MKKIGVIVQARMGSSRLPGKVLMDLHNKETILSLLIKRLKLSKKIDEIIIATTPDPKNKSIIKLAKKLRVQYFVGSEENVLKRYYEAAKKFNIDIVVRVTSDCPFNDPKILDKMLEIYENSDNDYINNGTNEKYGYFPRGFDIEIFSFNLLEETYSKAQKKSELEHVTVYITSHEDQYNIFRYKNEHLNIPNNLRLTIDEIDDFKLCKTVYKRLLKMGKPIDFSIEDIITIVNEHPNLLDINKGVRQKKIK